MSRIRSFASLTILLATAAAPAAAQRVPQPPSRPQWLGSDTLVRTNQSTFRRLDEWLPPSEFRSASGAPGPKYWQQQVDYTIRVTLDTTAHRLTGTARITYHNNAPEALPYLWFQLDQDIERKDSRAALSAGALGERLSGDARKFLFGDPATSEGYTLSRVQVVGPKGVRRDAATYRNGTQLRVDLPAPLATGQTAVLEMDWSFVIPEPGTRNNRTNREQLADGWNYLVAQWFPRAAVFDDVNGWQNVQFYGQGEFYLQFGNYDVSITVPRSHVVQATGVLQNPLEVLTATQRARLAAAMRSDTSVFIIRPDEIATPGTRPAGAAPMLTWRFRAERVRDFAFASFRGYGWDAAGYRYAPAGPVIAMHSLYPREAAPLWSKISTRAIATTMKVYGRMALPYPYPVASNVHGAIGGMEYPMIAFCGARPKPDGTWEKTLEYALAGVTIHEVGHNWFPMIIASDERKWTWLDEGVNSFLQYYAEQEFDPQWPVARQRGPARNIVNYMRNPSQVPIMTESDAIFANFGPNGYSKPATGLVMLREQILGPEAFDRAFREYSQRWAFRHPQPEDFFRTIVAGAGEKLDWFWRGWFYSTYNNDQAVASVASQDAKSYDARLEGQLYHRITVRQLGGLVMPLHLGVTYADGTTELIKLPADVWRTNEREFTHGFFGSKVITRVVVDPEERFADVERGNNVWVREGAGVGVP